MSKKCLFPLLFSLLLLPSCLNYESRYDGQWQLRTIESEGHVSEVDTVWYGFQTILFNYKIYDSRSGTYRSTTGYIDDYEKTKITLQMPDSDFIRFTDWKSSPRNFVVEHLSGSKLILSSDGKRYTFRKF